MFRLPTTDSPVINRFHRLHEEKGFISEQDLQDLARQTGRPLADLHGLLSFFHSLRTRPPGKNRLAVCYGTPCYARGAEQVYQRLAAELDLDENGTATDGFITVEKVQCVGACSLAPVIVINNRLEGRVKAHQLPARLKRLRDETPKENEGP